MSAGELVHLVMSPSELIALSNFTHHALGFAVLLIALSFFFDSSFVRRKLRPAIIVAGGAFLLGVIFLSRADKLPVVLQLVAQDKQQFQHVIIALVSIGGGIAEYLGQKRKNILALAFPAGLVILGIVLMLHPQHGVESAVEKATEIHQTLGILFIGSGFSFISAKAYGSKWLHYAGVAMLIAIGLILLVYQEPDGAYHFAANATG